jgi:DNA-binding transcriptional LysR family regulator
MTGPDIHHSALDLSSPASDGLDISTAPLWQVRSLAEPLPVSIHAVWPATRVLPARTQLFVEFLAARLKKERL